MSGSLMSLIGESVRVTLLFLVLAFVRGCLAVRYVVRSARSVGILPPKREFVGA
jgi:hypothetical protein